MGILDFLPSRRRIKQLEADVDALRTLYAAAKTNRLTGPWSPGGSDVNAIIAGSAEKIRARIRQLVRDFPYFARALSVTVDFIVGSGIMYQPRTGMDAVNLELDRAYKMWGKQADITGKLDIDEMQRLACRQLYECGEFLAIKHWLPGSDRFIPFCLQMVEPDELSSSSYGGVKIPENHTLDQGIEYETSTGIVTHYHFVWTGDNAYISGKTTSRVAAEYVIHGFKLDRPGQLRGISPFVPGVVLAHDLDNYMTSERKGAEMASKWLAVVKRAGGAPIPGLPGVAEGQGGETIEFLENAIIEYLEPGEDIEFKASNRPGTTFIPFVNLILTMFSISADLPYELVSGDYTGMNYSVSRAVRNDFAHVLKPKQGFVVDHFCNNYLSDAMNGFYLSGKVNMPGYLENPLPYLEKQWTPPGMESVDPKESVKNIAEIKAGIRSPVEVVAARGRAIKDVYAEIAAAKKIADEMGLNFYEAGENNE